jgi:hypothetical protein
MVTMQLVPVIADATGWQWAFAVLAFGPVAGIVAVRRFQALARARSSSGVVAG